MTAMASTLFVDDKERWVVLSDKTIRVHKAKGDEKVLSEIALTGVSRDFNVFDDEYKLFLHSGGDSTPAVTVLQTASIVLACDWWFQLTKVAAVLSIAGRMSTPLSPLSSKHPNAELITKFYAAFANKDWKAMQNSYADVAHFRDPAFGDLNSSEVRAMWRFLLRSPDLRVEFSNVQANEQYAIAHWDAWYTFSATGKKVVNRIDATFEIQNGHIVSHADNFSFHKWSSQALGGVGKVLGWSGGPLNRKVHASATAKLKEFMEEQKNATSSTSAAPAPPGTSSSSSSSSSSSAASHSSVYVERMRRDADAVWQIVGQWTELAWTGVVASCNGDAPQSLSPTHRVYRTLTFAGKSTTHSFTDELLAYDAKARSMTFTSVSSPLPLKNHTATISVRDDDAGGSVFTWDVTFDIADDADDAAAAYLVNAMRRLQARCAIGLNQALDSQTKR